MYILGDRNVHMTEGKKVRWTIASARQNFPTLVDLAAREPQDIYRRDELVAQVVPAGVSLTQPQQTAREMLAEIQRICAEENYTLEIPPRTTRPNPFLERESRRKSARKSAKKRRGTR
jgi:hypothetical protein